MFFKCPFKVYEIYIGKSFCGFKLLPMYIKSEGSFRASWLGGTIVIGRIKERAKDNRVI